MGDEADHDEGDYYYALGADAAASLERDKETRVKPYYEEAGITIYHADCRDLLPKVEYQTIVTDPPYGVGFDYEDTYDDEGGAAYGTMIDFVAWACLRADSAAVTPGIANLWRWPPAKWVLAWHKPGSPRRSALRQGDRPQGGFNEWEPILIYGEARFMHDALRYAPQPQIGTGDHPCPKPVHLLQWIIAGLPGAVLLDPFMGSGTTLRAAKDLGRKAIGIEIEERYCEIAANRLAQEVLDFGAAL